MVKRSIEQEIRNQNFGARSGNFETNAVVKNQETKQRGQRTLGDCLQWETNGQCVKGDNCSFRHDANQRGKRSPSNPSQNSFMHRDGFARITSKDFAITHSVTRWHSLQNACSTRPRVVAVLGRMCPFAHRQFDEQPTKRSQKERWRKCCGYVEKGKLARKRTCHRPMSRSTGETLEEK